MSSSHLFEHVKFGDYYLDARDWYKHKYIYPFFHRSLILLLVIIVFILFLQLFLSLYSLFPSITRVQYSITADSSSNKTAHILRANQINNDPLASISDIMVRNYVVQRESYDYQELKKQFVFIKNNSTRIVFRKFYNLMNMDNPSSPIMLYQKSSKKAPIIISAKYPDSSTAIIKFRSVIQNSLGQDKKNTLLQATINYEIDKINSDLPSGARFNFTVTNYQLKILEN